MNVYLSVIVIVSLALLFYMYQDDIETFISTTKVCTSIDGRCYPVVGKLAKFDSTISAAEKLAYLNSFCIKLIRHMRRKYLWEGKGTPHEKYMTRNLLENFNPDSIIENAPKGSVNTSYVEDKGIVFAICLREKMTGKNFIHKKGILEFVVLHELSHLASDTFGHEEMEFWQNFNILIKNAEEIGIHTPIDYKKYNENYCSLNVDYTPYFDNAVPRQ